MQSEAKLFYMRELLVSAMKILKLVKEDLDDGDLNEEQKADFQTYMDGSLCQFVKLYCVGCDRYSPEITKRIIPIIYNPLESI